jgi:hypothetical protein
MNFIKVFRVLVFFNIYFLFIAILALKSFYYPKKKHLTPVIICISLKLFRIKKVTSASFNILIFRLMKCIE